MKVPKTFQLAGITWTVERTDAIDELGHCDRDKSKIRIRSDLEGQMAEAVFCHELEHAILYTCGIAEHNEREVDAHGSLLHQFLTTWK